MNVLKNQTKEVLLKPQKMDNLVPEKVKISPQKLFLNFVSSLERTKIGEILNLMYAENKLVKDDN